MEDLGVACNVEASMGREILIEAGKLPGQKQVNFGTQMHKPHNPSFNPDWRDKAALAG